MANEQPHLSIAGVPVRIDWSFWVLAVLLGLGAREGWLLVAWVVIVLVSVLVHELGHAFAFRAYHQRPRVVLYAFGGLTYGSSPSRSRVESVVVSVAGPFAALFLLGLPALALRGGAWASADFNRSVIVHDVAWVNIVWSIANLLPVLPLDGGNVVASLVGVARARVLSVGVAGAAALYFFGQDNQFGALFALLFAFMNFAALQQERTGAPPRPIRIADLPHQVLPAADPVAHATELLRSGPDGPRAAAAYQRKLHLAGRFREAAAVAQVLYTDGRVSRQEAAFDAAAALAQAGETGTALLWLNRAVDDGLRNGALLDGEPDLAPLRELPGWHAVRARAS